MHTVKWFWLLKINISNSIIIKVFRTIVFIFIVISTMFLASFRCLSNLGTFTELRTMSFIETTWVACSDSVSHNWVQVLSFPVLLLACYEDWTCNLQMIVSLEAQGTNTMCWTHGVMVIGVEEGRRTYWPKRCGINNKDEDNSPQHLNDKNQQASSQKFRELISSSIYLVFQPNFILII